MSRRDRVVRTESPTPVERLQLAALIRPKRVSRIASIEAKDLGILGLAGLDGSESKRNQQYKVRE
jgi:hypothetical protein